MLDKFVNKLGYHLSDADVNYVAPLLKYEWTHNGSQRNFDEQSVDVLIDDLNGLNISTASFRFKDLVNFLKEKRIASEVDERTQSEAKVRVT